MKKNVAITVSQELIIPRDILDMDDLRSLQDKAIRVCKTSTDKEQKSRCLRFVLAVNDLQKHEELEKIKLEMEREL